MAEHDGIEALARFELPPTASLDELRREFRRLAKVDHPDAQVPPDMDEEEFKALSHTYDVACEYIKNRALVPANSMGVLAARVEQTNAILLQHQDRQLRLQEQAEARNAANNVIQEIVWHTVDSYRQYRQLSDLFAVLGVSIGLATNKAFSLLEDFPVLYREMGKVSPIIILIGILFALYSFMFRMMADRLEGRIKRASESLEDKHRYLDLTYQLLNSADIASPWSRTELVDTVDKWVAGRSGLTHGDVTIAPFVPVSSRRISMDRLAHLIGPEGFVRLYIATGAANGLLKEERVMRDGRQELVYSLSDPD